MQARLPREQKVGVLNGYNLWQVMAQILTRQSKIRQRHEYLWCVGLHSDSTIDFIELMGTGSLSTVQIEPRELFRMAVIKNVARVILVHNHPSGRLVPSQHDKTFTSDMAYAGKILGVEILDHLIISTKDYFSFKENKITFIP